MKTCSKCGETKPLEEFDHRIKRGKLVPRSRCRGCEKADRLEAYRLDPKKNLASQKKYRKNHPGRWRAYMTRWVGANRQHLYSLNALRDKRIKGNTNVVEYVERDTIIARDDSTCYLCGRLLAGNEIHIDHVVPISRGGTHTADNLRVACQPCNNRKYNKLLEELDWYQAKDCSPPRSDTT